MLAALRGSVSNQILIGNTLPTIKLYHHGMSAGIAPMNNSHERAKRGVVNGWSASAARNNTRWLRSVCLDSLDGVGVAFTLTIRDCPASSSDWHDIRTSFIKRLRRLGLLRLHWVTEWQRRGVPHLHGVAYFPEGSTAPGFMISHWLAVAEKYTCTSRGQHIVSVADAPGWFKYLSKHASRGASHYQRSADGIPEGWEKTGRVWGHCGDWKVDEPGKLMVSNSLFWALRRIIRAWRKADARAECAKVSHVKNSKIGSMRIVSARRMLKCNERKLSSVRGLSEWLRGYDTLLIIEYLYSQGYEIYPED